MHLPRHQYRLSRTLFHQPYRVRRRSQKRSGGSSRGSAGPSSISVLLRITRYSRSSDDNDTIVSDSFSRPPSVVVAVVVGRARPPSPSPSPARAPCPRSLSARALIPLPSHQLHLPPCRDSKPQRRLHRLPRRELPAHERVVRRAVVIIVPPPLFEMTIPLPRVSRTVPTRPRRASSASRPRRRAHRPRDTRTGPSRATRRPLPTFIHPLSIYPLPSHRRVHDDARETRHHRDDDDDDEDDIVHLARARHGEDRQAHEEVSKETSRRELRRRRATKIKKQREATATRRARARGSESDDGDGTCRAMTRGVRTRGWMGR